METSARPTSAIGKINRDDKTVEIQGQMNTAEFFSVDDLTLSLPDHFRDYESKLSKEILDEPEKRQAHLQMRPLTRFEKIPGAGYISIIFGFVHVATGKQFIYRDELSKTATPPASPEVPSNRGIRRAKERDEKKSSKKGKGESSPSQ